jgi:DNA-binding winged helix-turn-helix (wHTH) protein
MTQEIAPSQDGVFSFGNFELLPKRRLLTRDGKPVKIGSRALDLLVVLVENAGNVIAKNDLILRVWGNVIVEDTNLRVHISVLRRVLGDDGFESRFIVHVARRGYIFVAPLGRPVGDSIASATPDWHSSGTLGTPAVRWGVLC